MFVFKGISSIDMEVIVEEEIVFLGKASQKYVQNDIEGMDGALFEEQGYAVIDRPIKVQVLNTDKLDKILAWLDGTGVLEFQGRITKARFYNEVTPTREASINVLDFSFIRDPFWIKKRDDFVEIKNVAFNEGTIYSRPVIRLEKNTSDRIDITVNNVRFAYNFKNEKYAEIDCEKCTTVFDGLNRDRQIEIGYDFPILNPGENKVIVHSGDAKIKIKRKDRWL